jgi:hypothetical protein
MMGTRAFKKLIFCRDFSVATDLETLDPSKWNQLGEPHLICDDMARSDCSVREEI